VILKARETDGGPFKDLFDFCRRIDKRVVNRRVIEALIRAGAFDAHRRPPRQAAGLGRRRPGSGRAGRAQCHAGRPVRHAVRGAQEDTACTMSRCRAGASANG
jgi:hypothetical protein